ncbi:hypothetical protein [Arsenophonus apicola]|uniref:hypothetical protein n=1 Tax=Arsenophonus apicola TaxID=2879119 RepID=UPI001CDBC64C|nr:hypothetical protein [Arsenophonus apicola]UBX30646.1 hypothetical protein LDL57_15930 [Arsenophonus apicola]
MSNREPNVIAVMNDRIVEANSAAGKLADKKATDSGALILPPKKQHPFRSTSKPKRVWFYRQCHPRSKNPRASM